MAKKQTKDQKIAALEADAANLRAIAREALNESAFAREQLAAIKASPADSRFCARLADVVFVDKSTAERNAVGYDDVAERVCALLAIEEAAEELVQEVTGISNNPKPLDRQIDEAKSKAYDLNRTQESFDGLPSDWAEWAEWIEANTFAPADIDRMVELLDLLGLSGNRLNAVLASADIPTALKAYK
jgi:hypothetical protein